MNKTALKTPTNSQIMIPITHVIREDPAPEFCVTTFDTGYLHKWIATDVSRAFPNRYDDKKEHDLGTTAIGSDVIYIGRTLHKLNQKSGVRSVTFTGPDAEMYAHALNKALRDNFRFFEDVGIDRSSNSVQVNDNGANYSIDTRNFAVLLWGKDQTLLPWDLTTLQARGIENRIRRHIPTGTKLGVNGKMARFLEPVVGGTENIHIFRDKIPESFNWPTRDSVEILTDYAKREGLHLMRPRY